MITEQQLINIFNAFERDENLFELKIDDIKFWDFIRIDLYSDIKKKIFKLQLTTKTDMAFPWQSVVKGIMNLFINTISNIGKLNIKYDIVFLNHPRRKLIENKYVDIYTDYIIDNLDSSFSVVSCETLYQMTHLRPAYTESIYYLDKIDFMSRFVSRFFTLKITKDDQLLIYRLNKYIKEIFNVDIDLYPRIKRVILRYKFIYKQFNHLFSKIRPKIVVFVDSYSLIRKIAVTVANEHSITTVELQHGTVGTLHIGYNYPPDIFLNSFPKYFYSWGDFWTGKTNFPKVVEVVNVGFPFFDIEKDKYSNINRENKLILVISQGTVGKEISNIVIALAKLLPNHTFYYKLHPVEVRYYKQNYKDLDRENILIITDNSMPLYKLFSICTTQIGVYSTAIAEGISFNLRTVILKLGHDTYTTIKNLNLLVSSDPIEISKFISQSNNIVDLNFRNQFFLSDSLSRVSKKLQELITS